VQVESSGRTEDSLRLTTDDGESLAAIHVSGSAAAHRDLAVVVGHGFTGSIQKPGLRGVIEGLACHADVIAVDFRGHGRSSGVSTVGDLEVLDLQAAVDAARGLGYRDVVTCGWSMGGSIVLRHAALHRGVDAVVSVSAVSRWFYRDTKPMRRVHWAIETRLGRLITHRAFKTRISGAGWDAAALPESPVEVGAAISPIPLLVVHGHDDHYFPVDQGQAIFDAAREPKELWLVEGFGHAENSATPELLDRIGRHLPELIARGR
jgi:pimeloyl-ACP methyl ester carboxylesterase